MTKRARLNYLNDTLFGPIAKTIDCDVLITPSRQVPSRCRCYPQYLMIYTRLTP
jgi:hypothetical protein